MSDKVKNAIRPDHYDPNSLYEPIKVIEAWDLNFNLGNTVKYVARAGKKDDIIQELNKAKQYLEFEIARIERLRLAKIPDEEIDKEKVWEVYPPKEIGRLVIEEFPIGAPVKDIKRGMIGMVIDNRNLNAVGDRQPMIQVKFTSGVVEGIEISYLEIIDPSLPEGIKGVPLKHTIKDFTKGTAVMGEHKRNSALKRYGKVFGPSTQSKLMVRVIWEGNKTPIYENINDLKIIPDREMCTIPTCANTAKPGSHLCQLHFAEKEKMDNPDPHPLPPKEFSEQRVSLIKTEICKADHCMKPPMEGYKYCNYHLNHPNYKNRT